MTAPAVIDEITGQWRRDLAWSLRCHCGHDRNEHRHDMKTGQPCYRGGCGCQRMRPQYVVWREVREVLGRLEETP